MPADVTDRPMEGVDADVSADNSNPAMEEPIMAEQQFNDTDRERMNQYLTYHDISIIPVRGNGHCLLYAVSSALYASGAGIFTDDALGKLLSDEIEHYLDYYRDFATMDDLDIITVAVQRFLHEKQYNNNMCDVFLNAMCNAMCMKAVVIRMVDEVVNELVLVPGRPGVEIQHTIYLILHGSDLGAHYNAAMCKTNSDSAAGKDVSTPSTTENTIDSTENCPPSTSTNASGPFSPESVKPHPKAPKRKAASGNRKRRKTCILTDTPEKEALREEQEQRKLKRQKKQHKKPKTVNKKPTKKATKNKDKPKRPTQQTEVDSDDGDDFCLICLELFSNSLPEEKWIQCTSCKQWAHDECADTEGRLFYECHNCESDVDNDEE